MSSLAPKVSDLLNRGHFEGHEIVISMILSEIRMLQNRVIELEQENDKLKEINNNQAKTILSMQAERNTQKMQHELDKFQNKIRKVKSSFKNPTAKKVYMYNSSDNTSTYDYYGAEDDFS